MRFTDEDLKRISEGDNEPLKKVYANCFDNCVLQLVSRSACDKADAEDIVMDSFLVLRDKIVAGEFKNDNVQAYLVTVAFNRWRNKIKRDRRLVAFDPAQYELNENATDNIDDEKQERVNVILNSINKIGDSCKELLTKNLLEGIPLKELVDIMSYSGYDVIKTTKSRCMKKLRSIINETLTNH